MGKPSFRWPERSGERVEIKEVDALIFFDERRNVYGI
jgi:hypothetical protein